MHNTLHLRLLALGVSLSAVLASALAQSPAPEREKPGLKDFGSSLKQLKWDPKTRTAIETIYSIIPGYRLTGLTPEKQMEMLRTNRVRTLQGWDVKPDEIKARVDQEFRKLPPEIQVDMARRALSRQLALAGVAKISGGWSDYLEDPSQADAVYSRIFFDMIDRYIIGYYPTNKERDGKRRKIKVEVRGHPEYVVWGRKAYYASGPEE
jgi:hypothetical protein